MKPHDDMFCYAREPEYGSGVAAGKHAGLWVLSALDPAPYPDHMRP